MVLAKFIRLHKLSLDNTRSAVRFGKDPPSSSLPREVLNPVTADFFKLMLEKVIRATGLNRQGKIFYKSLQLLACANDVDNIDFNNRGVRSAFFRLDKETKRMRFIVNKGNIKYLPP